jgi:ribosomal-protein-alanine N-acetyltransferase
MQLQTQRLNVVLQTREDLERMIKAMPDDQRAQLSEDWLARMRAAQEPDPWIYAFRVVHRETGNVVGTCSFKGPPVDGIVEIAYGTDADHEGNGYATEAARALVDFASSCEAVCLVRAHTLPDAPASKRVLRKCGFEYVGETIDPDDGLVARFQRPVGRNQDAA